MITITLLAFLVLLLVSLASLTRVETQVAGNNQQLSQARQNALMALNIALGQLQKYAGPDQRTTARADILTSYVGSPTPGGNGDANTAGDFNTFWSPRSRYWTGVWGNSETAIGYDLRPNQIPNGRGITPVTLNWLVSGNENTSLTLNGTRGGVSAPVSPIRFVPNIAVAGLSAAATTKTELSFPGVLDPITGEPTKGVLLVGPASTSDGSGAGTTASFNVGNFVVAPAVTITAPASSIPGLGSGNTATPIGRYAWWVGDEGTKVRVNLQEGFRKTGLDSDQINSFITSQRSGIEFIDRDHVGTVIGANFSPANINIPQIMASAQLPLIGDSGAAQVYLANASKNRFHDLTSYSYGVLADSYAGGLKKDLTADISDSSTNSSYRPADSASLFLPIASPSNQANLPTWGHLRSWARTNPDAATGEVSPSPATDTNAGLAPVVASASIGFDVYIDAAKTVQVAFFPVVVLSNPYPVPIAPSRYDIGFKLNPGSRMLLQVAAPAPSLVWQTKGIIDWSSPRVLAGDVPASPVSEFIRFIIDGSVIPPGESHIYRMNTSGGDYSTSPPLVLSRAPDSTNINLTNHVMLSTALTLDPSVVTMPTLMPDGITTTTETSYFFRVHLDTMARSYSNASVSGINIVFSREGDLNNEAGWYQNYNMIAGPSVGNGNYGQLQIIKSATPPKTDPITATDPNNPDHASSQRIANNWNQLTGGARAALRLGSAFEYRGDSNAADRFGMIQSTRVWMRHGNIRAPYVRANAIDAAPTPGNKSVLGSSIMGVALSNEIPPNRDVTTFGVYNRYALFLGLSYDFNPSRYVTLFDVLQSQDRFLSLGQLQHAPFSRYGFYPANAFGNSMGEMRIPRTSTYRSDMVIRPGTTIADPGYDISWHLNRAIWDKTFVSGVPSTWTQNNVDEGKRLPNPRMTAYAKDNTSIPLDELRFTGGANKAYDKAATHLMVAGSFNINSTSEQAWRGILGGAGGLPSNSDYSTSGDHVDEIIPFPRISHNLSHAAIGPHTGITDTMVVENMVASATPLNFATLIYNGNRGLYLRSQQPTNTTNTSPTALVNELARTIVREIRRRGPFLSLADFVNRAPIAGDRGIKGALQTAIDTMQTAQANPFATWVAATGGGALTSTTLNSDFYTAFSGYDTELYMGGPASELGTGREAFTLYASGMPRYLTQADVLSKLGPLLSARSDTFTIRTYGETINPVTQTSEGQAWCEAVVQRLPDYVDSVDIAEKLPTDPSLNATNKAFGRKFKVVSFRWLSPSEI